MAIAFAFVAVASAIGGAKDFVGNYYDYTTGQVSSSLTGRVYNTRPTSWGPAVPAVAAYHAPYAYAHHPYAYAAPYAYGHHGAYVY